MKKLFKNVPYFIIAILVGATVAYAGNPTPPGIPAKTMKSISDLYQLINTGVNTPSTDFTTPSTISSTMNSLGDTYDLMKTKISDIDASKILTGTTIFGKSGSASPGSGYTYGDTIQSTVLTTAAGAGTYNVSNLSNSVIKKDTTWGVSLGSTGTLTPDGGTAGVADVFNGKTANLTADWTLDTGTLNLACNTATFNGTGNLVADAYDGGGSGSNRWCMTDSGDAVAGEILLNKIAWVNGVAITGTGIISLGDAGAGNVLAGKHFSNATTANVLGTMVDNTSHADFTPAVTSVAIPTGFYDGVTKISGDANLVTGNIKNGVTIFGVAGNVIQSLGDATAGNVLAGKYFSNATTANVLGTMVDKAATSYTPSAVVQTIVAGYYNGSGTVATDANLVTGNIKNGVTIFGVAGNVIQSLGDATAGNVLAGKHFSNATTANVLGTMTDNTGLSVVSTAQSQLTGVNYLTAPQGYYDGTAKVSATDAQVAALNANLVTGNIASGISIFGVAGSLTAGYTYGDTSQAYVLGTAASPGTALKNLWNGTMGSFTGGSQANGGVDDYSNGSAQPGTTYSGTWHLCASGDSVCNSTTYPGAAYRDMSTGLIWSKTMNSSTYALDDSAGAPGAPTWYIANNCTESGSPYTCTHKTSAKTGCEATAGWEVPTQKQLMQAYIDGSYGALEGTGVHRNYWSATTRSDNTTNAWFVYLSDGYTFSYDKTFAYAVRCVR